MIYQVTLSGRTFEVELGADGVSVDGQALDADLSRLEGGPTWSLALDGASHRFTARRVGKETWDLHLRGRRLRADVVDERTRAIRQMTGGVAASLGPKPIKAPMPGMVVKVEVEEGDTVGVGQGVVIVEAMKMENELKAAAAARVVKVHVSEGEAVEKDQLLVDLAALDEDQP
ncbi:MAG: acetyl-CoA carboxylase biotin carboxyl carrier protein subunit [Gemmatimonadetes bacterium]|nr:acetyl-CoA carboxylase biotin carboxyl carrier protein subunit [Gemmatimonadota bacterium]NNF14508.1 acetyl-CoA carboxylase biotin carboxyl carrier protein subunit [Gemmatimonadota bacterium]